MLHSKYYSIFSFSKTPHPANNFIIQLILIYSTASNLPHEPFVTQQAVTVRSC